MTPEFHREIGIPRVAAIEYPYGRPIGQVNDVDGQREVLQGVLSYMEKTNRPGQICHLPFTWPEEPKHAKWQPPEMSPIVNLYLDDIKKAGHAAKRK